MKNWQKTTHLVLIFALVLLFSVAPLNTTQAKSPRQLREVVFIHYKLPPELTPAKGGNKPIAACTLTTNDDINDYGLTGWYMPSDGLAYQINISTLPDNLNVNDFINAIDNATNTWTQADNSQQWSYGGTTNVRRSRLDGVNLVSFGGASGGIAVTRTWYWTDTHEVAESDITFASNMAWSISNANNGDCGGVAGTYDVQDIATHEFGHQVGLVDLYSSADKDLTMYGYGVTTELKKDSLGTGDVSGALAVAP